MCDNYDVSGFGKNWIAAYFTHIFNLFRKIIIFHGAPTTSERNICEIKKMFQFFYFKLNLNGKLFSALTLRFFHRFSFSVYSREGCRIKKRVQSKHFSNCVSSSRNFIAVPAFFAHNFASCSTAKKAFSRPFLLNFRNEKSSSEAGVRAREGWKFKFQHYVQASMRWNDVMVRSGRREFTISADKSATRKLNTSGSSRYGMGRIA